MPTHPFVLHLPFAYSHVGIRDRFDRAVRTFSIAPDHSVTLFDSRHPTHHYFARPRYLVPSLDTIGWIAPGERAQRGVRPRRFLDTSTPPSTSMPATRSGRKPSGSTSLFGHFQPTKKSTGGVSAAVKGKDGIKTRAPPQQEQRQQPVSSHNVVEKVPVQQSERSPDEEAARYSTPEAQKKVAPSPVVSINQPTQASSSATSSVTAQASTPSPPPELLGSPTRPLTVREDPDRRKLYLLISPSKKSPASPSKSTSTSKRNVTHSAPGQLSRPVANARQSSPTLDRTPVRHHDVSLPAQPPAAPRKRRLSQVDFDQVRKINEESPLPHDKRRPSYRALGASQECGLSLMDMRSDSTSDAGASRSQSPIASGSGSDDDLLITPRKVRERGSGIQPPSFATPTKAARFQDPFSTPRPKPTLSAGIFSSLVTPNRPSASSSRRALDPPTASAASSSDEDNPFLDASRITLSTQPQEIPTLPYAISPGLQLPSHFKTILLLHSALEHALVVHLATAGTASSSTSMDSDLTDSSGQSVVRLPNLISYSTLRPLVERTAGRRLGPVELARLMYIWSNGRVECAAAVNPTTAPTKPIVSNSTTVDRSASTSENILSGLGFLLGRQRCLDSNGRRSWDWSLGIELTIKRARRQVTPPMQVSFGTDDGNKAEVELPSTPTKRGVASSVYGLDTPPSTPSSPSKRKRETSGELGSASPQGVGREGMSFVALWNNGMEQRKSEVGKRLRSITAGEMEQWLASDDGAASNRASSQTPQTSSVMAMDDEEDSENIPRPSTPERRPQHRAVQIGPGGLPTPSSTRPDGKRRRVVDFNQSIMEVDSEGRRTESFLPAAAGGSADARNDDDASSLAAAALWSRPTPGEVLATWPPAFDLRAVKPLPCAVLPSLREERSGISADDALRRGGSYSATMLAAATQEAGDFGNAKQTSAVDGSHSSTTGPGSEARAMSLMERIKAKQAAAAAASSIGRRNVTGSADSSSMMTNVKRRATLSRLPELASALYMLYTASSSSTSTTSGHHGDTSAPSSTRLPVLPLPTVIATLSKSSRVSLSPHEARMALDLLNELVPGTVELRPIGGTEWASLNLSAGGASGGGALAEVRRRVREELSQP